MLVLATDLDGTFLGGSDEDRQQLYRLIQEHPSIRLVFVTGRGVDSVVSLLNDPRIPTPDFIIGDVGATVVDGLTLDPVQPLQAEIEHLWPGSLVVGNKLKDIPGLQLQRVPMNRRSSYFYSDHTDMEQLQLSADALGCDVVVSAGKYIDVLPPGINKGSTFRKLVKLLGVKEDDILVAGDTLNDLSLFRTGYKGVVVGEAEPALIEATVDQEHIYHAASAGCGGILEAFKSLGIFTKYDLALTWN